MRRVARETACTGDSTAAVHAASRAGRRRPWPVGHQWARGGVRERGAGKGAATHWASRPTQQEESPRHASSDGAVHSGAGEGICVWEAGLGHGPMLAAARRAARCEGRRRPSRLGARSSATRLPAYMFGGATREGRRTGQQWGCAERAAAPPYSSLERCCPTVVKYDTHACLQMLLARTPLPAPTPSNNSTQPSFPPLVGMAAVPMPTDRVLAWPAPPVATSGVTLGWSRLSSTQPRSTPLRHHPAGVTPTATAWRPATAAPPPRRVVTMAPAAAAVAVVVVVTVPAGAVPRAPVAARAATRAAAGAACTARAAGGAAPPPATPAAAVATVVAVVVPPPPLIAARAAAR